MKKHSGFTLLEILLVVAAIAILAGIVIVAINPAKQLAQVRNTSRHSDINSISNAIYQYSIDNSGLFPANVDTNFKMLGTAVSGCNVSCGIGTGLSSSSSVSITDNSQSTFAGAFSNTVYNANNNLLNLVVNQTSGTYTSDIKDASASATWTTLAWTPNRPTGKALPNNSAFETGYPTGDINMTGNKLLLHLDESGGATTFADSSGNNNNGTCSGAICPTMGVVGKFGSGGGFDGVGNYIGLPFSNVSFSNLSLSMWFKSTAAYTGYGGLFGNQGWVGGYLHCQILATSVLQCALNSGAFLYSTTKINQNQWYHMTYTLDNSSQKVSLYINGIKEVEASSGNYNIILQNIRVGLTYDNNRFFKGTIDEIALYNRALSTTEVSDVYKRGALSLKYQVKSCSTVDCSDSTFSGPDGTASTYYSEASNTSNTTPSFSLSNIANNRYFQYKSFLDTTDNTLTAELKSVTINGSTIGGIQSASSTISTCLEISSALVPNYITAVPFDPKTGSNSQTYYAVKKTAGGRINVQSCSAENGENISVTR